MKGPQSVRYRLSPNEEARLIKDEREKRRKARLLQVREQAKLNAAKIRQAVQDEKNKQLQILAQDIQEQWVNENEERARKLEEMYIKNLKSVGEGHRLAEQHDTKEDMRAILKEEDKRRAKVRHNNALRKQRIDDDIKREEENKHIFARQSALEIEKIRASDVASRPPPPPNPADSIEPLKVKPIQFTDLNAFSATHFHIPTDVAVAKANDSEQIDAKASAEEEEMKIRDLDLEKKRLEIERKEKARLRHNHARDREVLRLEYDKMMHDLSDLQRADRNRRQNIVHKVPKQIFMPPHRRLEEKEDEQRDMERKFEDMYLAATDYMGNLSLALDPHPVPDTPEGTESLELSILDDEVNGESQLVDKRTDGDQFNASERVFPPLKTQLNVKDKSSDTTLKKLFEKIKSQREEWISKSSAEEASEADGTDSSSSVNGQVRTLTQYTITSGESQNGSQAQLDEASISTGEASSKTATTDSEDVRDGGGRSSRHRQKRYYNGETLEEGSITSSGTVVDGEENALLHPAEIANKFRQKGPLPTGDVSAFLADERKQQDEMKSQEMQIMEETVRHQKDLEKQRELLERRLREIDHEAKEAHRDLIMTHQQAFMPLEPSVSVSELPTMDHSTQMHSRSAEGLDTDYELGYDRPPAAGAGTFSRSLPPMTSQGPSAPVYPSQFSHSLPTDVELTAPAGVHDYSSASEERYSGEQQAMPISFMQGSSQYDTHPVQTNDQPFMQAEDQIKHIHEYQEQLMLRHKERQEALQEARQNLDKRARTLLNDSLHQVGLDPIYAEEEEPRVGHPMNLEQFQDVEFSTSSGKTRSDTNTFQRRSVAYDANYVADRGAQAAQSEELSSEGSPVVNESDLRRQLEEIERQKEEILLRDQYHREQIDRLKQQWEDQFSQTKELGDRFKVTQSQVDADSRVLHLMSDDAESIQQNMDSRSRDASSIQSSSRAEYHADVEDSSFGSEEQRHIRPELSTIAEQQTPAAGPRNVSFGSSHHSSGGSGSFKYDPEMRGQSPSFNGSNGHSKGGASTPDLEAQSIEAFGQRLAQIQQDFGQLTDQVNGYLDDPEPEEELNDTLTENDAEAKQPSGHSTPNRNSRTSSTQNIIDELISPLRGSEPQPHQQPGPTWHERLRGFDVGDDFPADQSGLSGNAGEFFAMRPEYASPSIDDGGFDRQHRFSSTPVTKKVTSMQKTPEFQPLHPDSTGLSSGPIDQSHYRSESQASDRRTATVLSEPSQYPLGNDSGSRLNHSLSSSGSKLSSNRTPQSPSQYPLGDTTAPSSRPRPRSPTGRYVSDPYLSSGSSSRENADELTQRIEATLSAHEQLLRESREIRERHASQRKSPVRISSEGQLFKDEFATSPGISEEPDLTLVSAASDTDERFSPLKPSPDKSHTSLNSFEQHEKSVNSDGSPSKYSPLKGSSGEKYTDPSPAEWVLPAADSARSHRVETVTVESRRSMDLSNGSDLSNGASDEGKTISLQDAFKKDRAKFIEASTRRKLEAKEKARQAYNSKQTERKGDMMKTLVSWKKQRSAPKQPAEPKRRDPTNITTVTSAERQKKEISMKDRTSRLYSQLDEVKAQKTIKDRQQLYAQNREKAKEYHKKHQEKMKKKK